MEQERAKIDFGQEIEFLRATDDARIAGVWVKGEVNQFTFSAKLYELGTAYPAFQNGRSRISKLSLVRKSDGEVVYEWDRGLCVEPVDNDTRAFVEWLERHLAVSVFGDCLSEAI